MKVVLPAVVMFLISLAGPLSAAQYDDEESFFSYGRFYSDAVVMEKPPRDGALQKEVSRFLNEFSEGIYAITSGDLKLAEEHLKTARGIWPEYFGTDFLLARINEDSGNFHLAARYYKSYLNKLRSFWLRENRISEKLIESLTPHGVENYERARDAVERRLKTYGIELDRVRPVYTIPPLVKMLVLFFAAVAGYVLLSYVVLPYVRKRIRIAGAPKGYWVCPKCGVENTVLNKECGTCRTPRHIRK
ncbi:MAG: hypothetical protein PHU03_08240 [Syntrophales bacterium]|nr:hypothetical protein [Syntrophales bacterium]